ncbi:hypothetical protein C2S53_016829 [Perilla frutescens var. hirtella]|uniref:Uncharacterized protein n=1 Tax=Perilla frutescens var. hirtella TaxID=608512 RepID=A0AAD4J9Q3_PERFH|nr:hypothetical protein C2S53_016829 [Perilla frutescens var. hirtella]
MKTAELEMDFEQETRRDDDDDHDHEEEEEEEEEIGEGNNNTSLLAGLNLVLIMSFLSLSEEDRSNFDEIQEFETGDFDQQQKHCMSKSSLQTRRRRMMNQFPAVERQSSRVHTKIRDSRHCRRF